LRPAPADEPEQRDPSSVDLCEPEYKQSWDNYNFAGEQILGLVRAVFFSGSSRNTKQVVFSGVDAESDMAGICVRTAEVLAASRTGRVCLVEADSQSRALEKRYGRTSNDGFDSSEAAGALPMSSHQVSDNVWLIPADAFSAHANAQSALSLANRLRDLRRGFDYTVMHAAPVSGSSATAQLARIADGLVLGIAAHRTRRIAAKKAQEHLHNAQVRLLGVVLSERRFPIPEKLYRRL
jgi:hypothetical protein